MKKENKEEYIEIKEGKSYPAVLLDVVSEYNHVKRVHVIKFIYNVYLEAGKTIEVSDNFSMWDYPSYYNRTLRKLCNTLSLYNLDLNLNDKDLRSDDSVVNSCKLLINTVVEIKKFLYKGTSFKVISTVKSNPQRVRYLWKCMVDNNLDNFELYLKKKP